MNIDLDCSGENTYVKDTSDMILCHTHTGKKEVCDDSAFCFPEINNSYSRLHVGVE